MQRPICVLVGLSLLGTGAYGATTLGGASGLTVTVDRAGSYTVSAPAAGWVFNGNIGQALVNMTPTSGSDGAGDYNQVDFDFHGDAWRHASIRSYYNRMAVLFGMSAPFGDTPNTFRFPTLTSYPAGLNHITFSGMFAHPTFGALSEDSPWVFFDGAGNTFVISAAANFLTSSTTAPAAGTIASGISSSIAWLPQGFSHQTLLVIDSGINKAFDSWGKTLTGLYGKRRPANDADPMLAKLSYWTDNGASYYYATEPGLSYPQTLEAVKAAFDHAGIGLGAIQLDSWFYPKGPQADWKDTSDGIYQYSAAAPLFGTTLSAFQASIGVPLTTHSRWIDASSPYRQQYTMSGNVSTDPRYWAEVAGYLAASGAATYEQDWLSDRAQTQFNLIDGPAFLDNMSAAMAQQNLTMQYCMATTRHFLQAAKYSNLTTIRTSQDRFQRSRWNDFLFASRLATALGIWPFTDVFMSSETENLLIATLSGGPVGIGDRAGAINAANLFRSARADGAIVKPDIGLLPLDSSFQAGAASAGAPVVAAAYTDFGDMRPAYVFAFGDGAAYQPGELGFSQQVYVYDYFAGSGRVAAASDSITAPVANGWSYQVVAPVGRSGIALIGDAGQFVTMGKKRIVTATDDGTLHLTMAFAPGETVRTVTGYAPSRPETTGGRMTWNPSTGLFGVMVTAGADGTASVQIGLASAARHGVRRVATER